MPGSLVDLGFTVLATSGTSDVLRRNGIASTTVRKHSQGQGEDGEKTIVQRILDGEVGMIVNTPSGQDARADGYAIRAAGTSMNAPVITTVQELAAAVQAIEAGMQGEFSVKSLQEHAADLNLFAAR